MSLGKINLDKFEKKYLSIYIILYANILMLVIIFANSLIYQIDDFYYFAFVPLLVSLFYFVVWNFYFTGIAILNRKILRMYRTSAILTTINSILFFMSVIIYSTKSLLFFQRTKLLGPILVLFNSEFSYSLILPLLLIFPFVIQILYSNLFIENPDDGYKIIGVISIPTLTRAIITGEIEELDITSPKY